MIKKIENILKNSGISEYKKEAQMLVVELSGLSLEEILMGKEISNQAEIVALAKKRAQEKIPVQYLIGYCYFMNEKYKVNSSVLIPRDETEILVRKCYDLIKNKPEKLDILDIGIGSGCICCSLANLLKDKEIEILGIDISSDAIITALENINNLNLERKVIVRKSDLFSKIRDCERFDLIVSNPPYIPISQEKNLQKELSFEPKTALFAPDKEGIEFYKKIIETAPKFLKPDGYLAFEVGINQAGIVKKQLEDNFQEIEIIKDLAGIERVVAAKFISN